MTHTAEDRPRRRLTRAEQRRREAAYFDPDRVVNAAAVNIACRMLGLTRVALAERMGMDRTHVARVIAAEIAASPVFRYRLCLALPHAEPEELFVAPGSPGSAVDVAAEADGDAA